MSDLPPDSKSKPEQASEAEAPLIDTADEALLTPQFDSPEEAEPLQFDTPPEASSHTEADPGEDAGIPMPEVGTAELEAARAEAAANHERLLRATAEMENLRKRADREVQKARAYALERFAGELLAVVDSLEMGVDAAGKEGASIDSIREGSELTLKMLLGVLEKFNVKPVAAQGERFNPELHEALTMAPNPELAPNTVMDVIQKGYQLNDRLLRPARVIVSQAP